MRICFVSMEAYATLMPGVSETAGGAGFQVVGLARELHNRGHEISILVGDYGQPLIKDCEGIRAIRTNKVAHDRSKIRALKNLWKLWRGFRVADADVYVLRSTRYLAGFCWLYSRLLRKRFVFMIANASNCRRQDREGVPGVINKLYGMAIKRANRVTAQSMDQHRTLFDEFGVDACLVMNGIDASPAQEDRGTRDYDILWVGSIKPQKQPHLIVETARTCPDLSFVVVGGAGSDSDYYDRVTVGMADLPNVDFRGFVPPDRVSECYTWSRLFLNTSIGSGTDSWHEGFPNTYLYSWMKGTPTCSQHVDPDGVISRNELGIVEPDLVKLVSSMRKLLDNETAYSRISDNCKAHVAEHHSLDCTTDSFLECLKSG